jgi:hypothetical protein
VFFDEFFDFRKKIFFVVYKVCVHGGLSPLICERLNSKKIEKAEGREWKEVRRQKFRITLKISFGAMEFFKLRF